LGIITSEMNKSDSNLSNESRTCRPLDAAGVKTCTLQNDRKSYRDHFLVINNNNNRALGPMAD